MGIEISRAGRTLGIGRLPGRRMAALYTVTDGGTTIKTIAWFRTEADCDEFRDILFTVLNLPIDAKLVSGGIMSMSERELLHEPGAAEPRPTELGPPPTEQAGR